MSSTRRNLPAAGRGRPAPAEDAGRPEPHRTRRTVPSGSRTYFTAGPSSTPAVAADTWTGADAAPAAPAPAAVDTAAVPPARTADVPGTAVAPAEAGSASTPATDAASSAGASSTRPVVRTRMSSTPVRLGGRAGLATHSPDGLGDRAVSVP